MRLWIRTPQCKAFWIGFSRQRTCWAHFWIPYLCSQRSAWRCSLEAGQTLLGTKSQLEPLYVNCRKSFLIQPSVWEALFALMCSSFLKLENSLSCSTLLRRLQTLALQRGFKQLIPTLLLRANHFDSKAPQLYLRTMESPNLRSWAFMCQEASCRCRWTLLLSSKGL